MKEKNFVLMSRKTANNNLLTAGRKSKLFLQNLQVQYSAASVNTLTLNLI
ncbi:hypothetical protein M2347_003589 [Chryseobacterium sp. H1D6B]|nr:hypothetical protein [Chryseobacterium sp. H1D6B]